ncbi:MAG: hypothetical protein QM736_24875, partial [Vicinamibacterales bacterium]
GHAVLAFNTMATQLHESRARLVHLTQMASWQSLARKTAHELKNSLTPIRLTVEEMLARQPPEVDRTVHGTRHQHRRRRDRIDRAARSRVLRLRDRTSGPVRGD